MADAEKLQRKKRKTSEKSLANLKPFQKGKSGNPNGKEKGTLNRSTLLKKWLAVEGENGTVEDDVILALIREATKGNVKAIQEIQDSVYGKIKDELEANATVKVEVEFV